MRPITEDEVRAGITDLETIYHIYYSGDRADEFVVDFLAHLRHFCDAHKFDFAALDRRAYQRYVEAIYLSGRTSHRVPSVPAIRFTAVPLKITMDLCRRNRQATMQGPVNLEGEAYQLKMHYASVRLDRLTVTAGVLEAVVGVARALIGPQWPLRAIKFQCSDGYSIELLPSTSRRT